jgi:hypothetical protein
MVLMKNINLLLRFALELCVLLSMVYWGFHIKGSWIIKFSLGFGLPIIVMTIWGMFIAPQSTYQLPILLRTILELIIFGLGAYALYASGHLGMSKKFSILVCINMILLFIWKQ